MTTVLRRLEKCLERNLSMSRGKLSSRPLESSSFRTPFSTLWFSILSAGSIKKKKQIKSLNDKTDLSIGCSGFINTAEELDQYSTAIENNDAFTSLELKLSSCPPVTFVWQLSYTNLLLRPSQFITVILNVYSGL